MAKGRMLNKTIGLDDDVQELSCDTARLLFSWIIAHLDQYGCFYGDAKKVKSLVFPLRNDIKIQKVEQFLTEFEQPKLIIRYKVDGRQYLFCPGFAKNQVGLRPEREPESSIPRYNGERQDDGKVTEVIRQDDGNHPPERKRKEKKGREVEEEVEVKEKVRKQVPPSPSPDTQRIVMVEEKLREIRDYESGCFVAERKAIKTMLKTYEPEEICACYVDLKRQEFWADKPLTMMSMIKQVGEWQSNVRKAAAIPGQPKPRRKWRGEQDARAAEIWEQAKAVLQGEVNAANYDTWLKDTLGLSWKGGEFVVGVRRSGVQTWLETRMHSVVKKTLIGITGQEDMQMIFEQVDQQFLDTLDGLSPSVRQIVVELLPGENGYGEEQTVRKEE